jgi:hypothetical protein
MNLKMNSTLQKVTSSKAHGRDDLFDRRSLNEWKPETGNGFLIFKRCQMSGLINDVVVTFDLFVC